MIEQPDNEAVRELACVDCGHVGSPINIGPGPGWLAIMLWATAAALWALGLGLQNIWVGYVAAPVFLAALIYTLWYFYRREKACRHCGTRWAVGRSTDPVEPTDPGSAPR